jgi:hypothetical protein
MNHAAKQRIFRAAALDKKLGAKSTKLLFILLHTEKFTESFFLPYKEAGVFLGLSDKVSIYRHLNALCPRYLKKIGVKGCPPTSEFRFQSPKTSPRH